MLQKPIFILFTIATLVLSVSGIFSCFRNGPLTQIQPQGDVCQVELKKTVTEFLNRTDVQGSLLYATVKILKIYDNELDGKIIVANYTTMNAIHPYFMCEAIEHHTAIITLSNTSEVVSAFCIWGSFHHKKIWDLLNQRWIQQEIMLEQLAVYIGKYFLDSIGHATGRVLSAKIEEETPNFYWHDLARLKKPFIERLGLCSAAGHSQ